MERRIFKTTFLFCLIVSVLAFSTISVAAVIPHVEGRGFQTIGLKTDGTVVAVGANDYGQCNVSGWSNIIQISAGYYHTVGLKADGTVVAVGKNNWGECNVSSWTNIIQISAGSEHTLGLKADGTVVATGLNQSGQCNVGSWTNIVQISGGSDHSVGLRSDGTVIAIGSNSYGQCNVGGLGIVTQVSAATIWTAGLESYGTVVTNGTNVYGQMNVGAWTNIAEIKAAHRHMLGLKPDGTVLAVGSNEYYQCNVSGWSNIFQVSGGDGHTVGLKKDGTVIAIGNNDHGQCNVAAWRLVVSTNIPNVVGMTDNLAEQAITDAGLLVGYWNSVCDPSVPAGHIISQDPSAGTSVPIGSSVNLKTSLGPGLTVPNVVGMTQKKAKSKLTLAGLVTVLGGSAYSSTVPAGCIISQTPIAGAYVCPKSNVSLITSLGPEKKKVPNLVGMTQSAAVGAITSAGLKVGTIRQAYSSTVAAGIVISQSPAAGKLVASNTAVSFTVSLGRKPR